jgi:DNA-binding CsgD family transcriptional regulator
LTTTALRGCNFEVGIERDVVGREVELDRLYRLIDGAVEPGGALLVIGDPGIGKSTLLRAAADHARAAGFLVLGTTGVESEAGLPYAGLYDLLRPALDGLDALPPAQRDALSKAFGTVVGSTPEQFLVALATLNLLAELATSRPLFVGVDDLQWLDGPTQAALAFVARRVSGDPIVVVGTTRRGFSGPFHAAGLDELDVAELSESAASEVLETTGVGLSRTALDEILCAALGNPLALVELPRAWLASDTSVSAETLPLTARLERAFAGRLSDLGPGTRDALLIAAIDSLDDLAEILAATSVLGRTEATVDTLEPAELAGLVQLDDRHVQFRHPLVRSAVMQSETLARRHAAHAALAEVLTDDPYRRTWHRAHAVTGSDDDVADELEANHRTALQRGSVLSAIWALERSAQLTTDPARRSHRLLLAAEHAFSLGRRDKVDDLLESASQLPLSDLDGARMEWLREIFEDGVPGDAGRVLELCTVAKRSAEAGDGDLALNLLHAAALRSWWADPGPTARARVVTVLNDLPDLGDDPRYVAALALAEPFLEAARVIDRLAHVPTEAVADADALRLLGQSAHVVGDPVRAVDFLSRAESRLREEGRLGLLSQVLTLAIAQHIELGSWDLAQAAEAEARQLARETGQSLWNTGTMLLEAQTAGLRGDNERAQALTSEAEQLARSRRLKPLLAVVQVTRGYAWLSVGRYSEAFDALVRIFDPADPSYHDVERSRGVMFLAEAAVRADRVAQARAIVADLEQAALVTPSPTLHVHLSYARAALADDGEAEGLYLAALSQDLERRPWARGRLELAYGSWLRRQRRVAESRSLLRSANATLSAVGATAWAEQARAELRAAGERTLVSPESANELLSPQEMQIARLASEGLSNRAIGERLFLSHRTVGSHLYRIFPKLGVTSRAQLAMRLASSEPSVPASH